MEVFGENHPEVSQGLKEISHVYDVIGKDEDAKKFSESSKKIKGRLKNENFQNIDSNVNKIKTLYLKISDNLSKILKN